MVYHVTGQNVGVIFVEMSTYNLSKTYHSYVTVMSQLCDILSGYYRSKKIAVNSTELELEAVVRQQKPLYQMRRHLSVHTSNICLAVLRIPTDGRMV